MTDLSQAARNLWGKKETRAGQQLWLPLVAHLIDTKNVINWLFNHWLSESQKNILYINHSEEDTQDLIKFLGYIHDIGKATPAFQTKKSYVNDESLDFDLIEKLIRTGLQGLDSLALSNPQISPHNRAGEAILENFGLNKTVAAIIGAHHGTPENSPRSAKKNLQDYASNYWQTQQPSPAQDKWQGIQKELIAHGLSFTKFANLESIPEINQSQAILLTGLIIMADWIASSEYFNADFNRPMFPTIDIDKSLDDIDLTARFRSAIKTWENEEQWKPKKVSDISKYYLDHWNFTPRDVQNTISQSISEAIDPGIVIIEAPMGIGKTEIALTAAEQLAFRKGENGLFVGLPTQATSNAMFDRVKGWLSVVSAEQNKMLSIKLMHGRAQFNSEFVQLPTAENIGEDNSAVIVNSWFSGKKSILEEFTVGTIDNLLLMGLKQRHLFLKHLGFSNKVVVIDEVHAYDTYMSQYLDKALEWLGAYHVPVIVLSATLPIKRRNQLLEAYSRGRFDSKKFDAPNDWQKNSSYPLMSMLDGQKLVQVANFIKQESKEVTVHRITADETDAVNLILQKIENGGIAGVIVNTVKRAQAFTKLIPKEISLIVLHSAFLAPDRANIEEELQNTIGKDGQRPNKMIIIGTQVLEQSLDIDFDILFTDIAPIDLILQRTGRLHRHNTCVRPTALQKPELFVMEATQYGEYKNASNIYENYLLMKTDYFLKDKIILPDDISPLVQLVYATDNDQAVPNISEAKEVFADNQQKSKTKARKFQIDHPYPDETIHGWLERPQLGLDKDDIKAQAAVRDIKETIEVIILKKINQEYYLLDGHKIDDFPENERDKIIAQQILRLPTALTPEWEFDSIIDTLEDLTAKYFPNWQESKWLKGAVALVLDANTSTVFNNWTLDYSSILGLSYHKQSEE